MNDPRCYDCDLLLTPGEDTPSNAVLFCTRDWSKRYEGGKFDSMPIGMNFGTSMKLTLHGRPAVWCPRAIEQTQHGRVHYGRRV